MSILRSRDCVQSWAVIIMSCGYLSFIVDKSKGNIMTFTALFTKC